MSYFALINLARAVDLKNYKLQIIVADESELTKIIVKKILHEHPSASVAKTFVKKSHNKKKSVYLTVGPLALRILLSQGIKDPIISTFTSSLAYRSVIDEISDISSQPITAVFAEPSPNDQFKLISLLFKREINVGFLLSDKNLFLLPLLQQAAAKNHLGLTVEHVSRENQINRALNAIGKLPVVLAVPDSTIYNAQSVKSILITSYRRNQAIVGYSTALVNAGALATVFSTPEDIVAQVEELLTDFDNSGRLREAQYPKYFSVYINEDVARSLNIVLDEPTRRFSQKPKTRKQ